MYLFYADEQGSPAPTSFFSTAARGRAGRGGHGAPRRLASPPRGARLLGRPPDRRGVAAERGPKRPRFARGPSTSSRSSRPATPLVAVNPDPRRRSRASTPPAPRLRARAEPASPRTPPSSRTATARAEARGEHQAAYAAARRRARGRRDGSPRRLGLDHIDHAAWAIALAARRPTPIIDRFWFRSIYREPSGVLFEIATPGLRRRRAARASRRAARPAAGLRAARRSRVRRRPEPRETWPPREPRARLARPEPRPETRGSVVLLSAAARRARPRRTSTSSTRARLVGVTPRDRSPSARRRPHVVRQIDLGTFRHRAAGVRLARRLA